MKEYRSQCNNIWCLRKHLKKDVKDIYGYRKEFSDKELFLEIDKMM
jgi:hypothetical protein